MTELEIDVKETSARLFDLYELRRSLGLLKSSQSYEERKKSYIDNALQELRKLQH